MSGNNYEDILDTLEEEEKVSVRKLIRFMSIYQPQVDIDRVFQRNLKNKILSKAKKPRFQWYTHLSYLSVLVTSFIVIFSGVWKFLWIHPIQHQNSEYKDISQGGISFKNNKSPIVTTEEVPEEIYQPQSSDDLPTLGVPLETQKFAKDTKKTVQDNSKNPGIEANTAIGDGGGGENLNEEIIDIANTIDSIANNQVPSPTPSSSLRVSGVAMGMTPPQDSIGQTTTSKVAISYASQMIVYKKNTPWNDSEIESRTGSGLIKILEKTLERDEVSSRIGDFAGGTEVVLYKTARKGGDEEYYYLIPSLKYNNLQGKTLFSPLIAGYSLH